VLPVFLVTLQKRNSTTIQSWWESRIKENNPTDNRTWTLTISSQEGTCPIINDLSWWIVQQKRLHQHDPLPERVILTVKQPEHSHHIKTNS
jgi:hypothetical protein